MQTGTVLLIILSAIIALAIVFYQYFFKSKRNDKLYVPLAILRFLALFSCLLLLINPKFIKTSYVLEKTNLVLLLDNSSSLDTEAEKTQLVKILDDLKSNKQIRENFSIISYSFGRFLNTSDSLTHDERATDIS
ncbi:MAG: VWA domain-containing protein, partial [Eudoraea sp.]|nr:VWA domain-containing protein [Eudoraea sp.]